MKKNALVLLLVCSTIIGLSQSKTQIEALLNFAYEKAIDYEQKKAEAIEWATRYGYPVTAEIDGSFIEIQYIDEFGRPQYYKTDNSTAAATISTNKVYPGGGAGLSLTGSGITVREWDAGSALTTHQEFGGRVTNVDGASSHYHSTHVGGTIMASGVVPSAKGMAYQANLRSRDWNNDVSEMASEGASGALMSCHSYGFTRGWYGGVWYGDPSISTLEDYLFGFYDSYTQQWDQVARNAPNYLICKSAGNDRGDSGSGYPPDGPYDCIGQQGVAKNILTVGAVEDIPGGYTTPSSVVMSSFSSWGPADDGRIKPDIVANGVSLYSTDNTSNTSYLSLSGTSMSTPSVTGSLALLQQHWNTLTASYMRSATLKALVIHTADEAGTTTGPDYMFGWGLMNTKNAALKISADQTSDVISELTLSNSGTYTRDVIALGTESIKVTIVWTDVAGTPTSAQLDPITPMLVNDLDLRLTRSGSTYYPWKLDRNNPTNAATNAAENNVDNVEVVYLASPVAGGTYTITVDHDGTLSGGSQAYSMIISGILSTVPPVADFLANYTSPAIGQTVTFNDLSSNNPTSWSWSFSPSTITYVGGTSSASQNPQVQFNAFGYYSITLTATNAYGSDSETKTNYINAINCTYSTLPFTESFSGTTIPTCWTQVDNQGNGQIWQFGTITSVSPNPALTVNYAYLNSDAYGSGNSQNADLITPTLNLSGYSSVTLNFQHSYYHYTGSSATLSYSINGGTSWTTIQTWTASTSNPATFNQVIAAVAGQSNVKFRWKYIGSYGWYWAVDNLNITGTPVTLPPIAAFSASTTTPYIGQTVSFTDLSTNTPTSWAWSFSPATITYVGGTTSASQNPQVQFTAGGLYTVTLTATNASGSDPETKNNYISVLYAPVANFSANNTAPAIGQTVTFTDLSANTPTSWAWSFSPATVTYVGGTSSTSQNPQVQFNVGGLYSVTLTATNASGSDPEAKNNYISVLYAPVANFSANNTAPAIGQTVTFTDLSTNTPTSWAWSFSPATVTYVGGTSSTSQNPQVQFIAGGLYSVTLTATNASGSYPETKNNYISVLFAPVANFSASTVTPNVGQTVTFTDLSTYTPTSWAWSFSPATITYVGGTGSASQNPQVQLNAGGLYSVTLTVTNASGSDGETKTDYISVTAPPVTDFSSSTTTPNVGQTVTFSDLSTNTPTSWLWAFAPGTVSYVEGTSAASQNPQVQFDSGGLYTVTLTATNAAGSDDEAKIDYVLVTAQPIADFSADNTSPGMGQTVAFTDLSINGPTLWAWSFTPSTITFVGGTNAMSQHPQVQFDAPGNYTVELTVSNAAGSAVESKADYVVVIYPPVADFTADITNPNVGGSVNFTDLSTNNPTTWSWIFIPTTITYLGGTTFNSQNPQVQFDAAGFYIVELTVSNASGSDTETKIDYILVTAPPIADFSADITTPGMGQTVAFTDLSINGPTLWAWSFTPSTVTFVGGTNAMSQNPQVQFDAPGNYTVELTVSNAAGSDIETKTDYVVVIYPPVADFTADITNPNVGGSVNFTDLSTNNPTTWSWIFIPTTITYLGGTTFNSQNPQVQFDAAGFYIVELTVSNASGNDTETKTDYILVINPVIDLDITVYLEGPFNGTSMTTSLNSILPLNQPYGVSPWNYAGTESVAAIPNANVVDWVLVELRDAADAASAISPTMMDRQAAFLLNNGRVVGLDGSSTLQFSNSLTQQLFVVIWHRNHLGMMSSNFLSESEGIYSYNFSTGATQAYGSTDAHKQIGPGVWGMIGGDGNRDGNITVTDKTPVWDTQSGTQGYLESDFNLDNQSDNKDKDDVWDPNLGMGSMVPN